MFFPQCRNSTPKCGGHPDCSHRLGAMENCMQLHIHLRSVRLGILDMLFQFYVFFKIMMRCSLILCAKPTWSRVRILNDFKSCTMRCSHMLCTKPTAAGNLTANDSGCFSCVISQCSPSVTMICPKFPHTLSSYF